MSLTLTLIQTDLVWENIDANLAHLEEKINSISTRTELIVLPEMYSTGFTMQPEKLAETMDGKAVVWMKRIATTKKVIIIGSLAIKEGENYFNRLIWMLPNGKYSYYDKRHLFAFSGEDNHYTSGNQRLIAQAKGWKINLQICYDLRFPVWARQQTSEGEAEYDLLIYVANWPEKRSHAWKSLLMARAIENQCYVVGVNRVGNDGNGIYHSGDSTVINPLGNVLFTEKDKVTVHTITLKKEDLNAIRNQFPFLKDADNFLIKRKGI